MSRLLLIDGNSIINRAFYGIMGNKMLMTADGTYTNAVYGFLAILFKIMDDLNPEYMAIAFDLKAPTHRHKIYPEYKGTRKGMPDELASQLPILKNILKEMNITMISKEGYEADDIIGTLAKQGAAKRMDVTILSGDRDTFQLITPKITVRIPRTKAGKTETEDFTPEKIKEEYGIKPKDLIEVKGLMGDTSDNIPGLPGVGEKTALMFVKKYGSIENLYNKIENEEDDLRGALREKVANNKELAILSKELGTINTQVPLENKIEDLEVKEWNKEEVFKIFKELRFSRYIERFGLEQACQLDIADLFKIEKTTDIKKLCKEIEEQKQLAYYMEKRENSDLEQIINKEISKISIYNPNDNTVYEMKIYKEFPLELKSVFENEEIEKIGYSQKEDYILLKQLGVEVKNMSFDAKIAAYLLNSGSNQYKIEDSAMSYLDIDFDNYLKHLDNEKEAEEQISLFGEKPVEKINYENALKVYCIFKLKEVLKEKLLEIDALELFQTIEMPLVEVLAEMQYKGIYLDKEELKKYGEELEVKLKALEKEIYSICNKEFNINSPKQLGEVLFEDLKLTVYKKNKSGYATDVDTLNKLKPEHPIIEKILDYRQVSKLNSTFVEGIMPYINKKTERVHSYFHQTVTTTGRISSTEPNMQNIPTRVEIGKNLRKVFKAKEGYVFLDADYSQIELRVFAHISNDKEMIKAFNNNEDIHTQAASKVFNVKVEDVTSELRTKAKAVNFGIVYGISDFGLGEQIGVGTKEAKAYIEQYMKKYKGIKKYMDEMPKQAKENGYVETLFKRRRYIPEITSNNYLVRKFGERAAMNTPIQGTAADIIKIAMIKVYEELKEKKLDAKLVLQIHDELVIEVAEEQKEEAKNILKNCMENVIKLSIPLEADIKDGHSWYEAK